MAFFLFTNDSGNIANLFAQGMFLGHFVGIFQNWCGDLSICCGHMMGRIIGYTAGMCWWSCRLKLKKLKIKIISRLDLVRYSI